MNEIAISTDNLSRDFGHVRAVDSLSLEVPKRIYPCQCVSPRNIEEIKLGVDRDLNH